MYRWGLDEGTNTPPERLGVERSKLTGTQPALYSVCPSILIAQLPAVREEFTPSSSPQRYTIPSTPCRVEIFHRTLRGRRACGVASRKNYTRYLGAGVATRLVAILVLVHWTRPCHLALAARLTAVQVQYTHTRIQEVLCLILIGLGFVMLSD